MLEKCYQPVPKFLTGKRGCCSYTWFSLYSLDHKIQEVLLLQKIPFLLVFQDLCQSIQVLFLLVPSITGLNLFQIWILLKIIAHNAERNLSKVCISARIGTM